MIPVDKWIQRKLHRKGKQPIPLIICNVYLPRQLRVAQGHDLRSATSRQRDNRGIFGLRTETHHYYAHSLSFRILLKQKQISAITGEKTFQSQKVESLFGDSIIILFNVSVINPPCYYENVLRHRYLLLHTGSSFRPLWFPQQRHLKSRWTTCFQACRHAARPNNYDSLLKVYFLGHIILLHVQRKSHYNEKLSRYFQEAEGNN